MDGKDDKDTKGALPNTKKNKLVPKQHIIDQLNLGSYTVKKTNFAVSSNKNFIKNNIERSSKLTPSSKTLADESKISAFLSESPKREVNVSERFYAKAELSKKKIEELKMLKEQSEVSGCTFQPKTNNKEKVILSSKKINEKFEEYLAKKRKKEENALEEQKKNLEKIEKNEEVKEKPTICEYSKEIFAKKYQQGCQIHERLYNQSKNKTAKVEEDSQKQNFSQNLNEKSQVFSRSGKLGNSLYEDAIRRQKNPPKAALSPSPKYLNSYSEKVLIDKFKKDFSMTLLEISLTKEEFLNYTQFLEFYFFLFFVRDKEEDKEMVLEIWKSLATEQEEYVSINEILSVSLAIMGYFEDWQQGTKLKFSKEGVKKFHKKNEKLYKNRNLVTLKSSVNQSFRTPIEFSFQPDMVAQSDELAEKWRNAHREPGKIEEALLAEKVRKMKRLEDLKKQAEERELKECSFKPNIEELPGSIYVKTDRSPDPKSMSKGEELYCKAFKLREARESAKTTKEIQEEKELEECTFKPNIMDSINSFNRFQNTEKISVLKTSPKGEKSRLSLTESQNLQSIKETLEDEVSPKPDFDQEKYEKTA